MRATTTPLRRALPAAMLALGLAACAPGDDPAGVSPMDAVAASGRYEFAFLARDPERGDARISAWVEDDCGLVAVARVDAMPIDDAMLRPDLVIEFAADGVEIQRWAKPYGAEIIALSGNRLVFGEGTAEARQAWWTDAAGAIGESADVAGGLGEDARRIECPALQATAGADALQCYEITDQAGLRRRLAWEGACS